MAVMGRYCKAYPIDRFRQFPAWDPTSDKEAEERGFFYLQENYAVTGDIFLDEHIVFDKVSPEWIEFCTNTLKFDKSGMES